jgi:hypothetical protein
VLAGLGPVSMLKPIQHHIPIISWLQGRCLPLMISVLGLLIIYPIFEEHGMQPDLSMRLIFSAVPIIAVFSLSTSRVTLLVTAVLVCIIILFMWLPWGFESDALDGVRAISSITFYIFCTSVIIRAVFIHQGLKDHPVYGGITAYLLMGLTFALMYQFIHSIDGGSFQADSRIHGEDHTFNWSDFIYFSFISLTTVGYGDIIPTSSFTRGLAVLESIAGVLYVAVLIAQLAIVRRADLSQKNQQRTM